MLFISVFDRMGNGSADDCQRFYRPGHNSGGADDRPFLDVSTRENRHIHTNPNVSLDCHLAKPESVVVGQSAPIVVMAVRVNDEVS